MKLSAFFYVLLARAVQGCTQGEQNARVSNFRQLFKQNIGSFVAATGMGITQATAISNLVTCPLAASFVSDFCTINVPGVDLSENCCYTCKDAQPNPAEPNTVAQAQTDAVTAAQTNPAEPNTVALTVQATDPAEPNTVAHAQPDAVTAAQANPTEPSTVAQTEECEDNEDNLNDIITSVALLSGGALQDNEIVQEIVSFRNARGDAGFSCAEAKLFLEFAGSSCTENIRLSNRISFKLQDYCCHTCRPAPDLNFGECTDTMSVTTCEERAQCDVGYKTFIMAIGEQVDSLPFAASEIYCHSERQISQMDGSQAIDWNAVANAFVSSGADTCLATTGPFGDAAANLIGQLPPDMPVSGWLEISALMGKVCVAMQSHEESFNTLLQAMPDNAEEYNVLLTAVG